MKQCQKCGGKEFTTQWKEGDFITEFKSIGRYRVARQKLVKGSEHMVIECNNCSFKTKELPLNIKD